MSFGETAGRPTIDMARVHARKNKIVTGLTKGIEFLFKKHAIAWIKGTGRLAGGGAVEVTGPDARRITSRDIVVATGSAPRSVPGITMDGTHIISSDEAIHLPAVPKAIAIMGSSAWSRCRVRVHLPPVSGEVTLIELLPRRAKRGRDRLGELERRSRSAAS